MRIVARHRTRVPEEAEWLEDIRVGLSFVVVVGIQISYSYRQQCVRSREHGHHTDHRNLELCCFFYSLFCEEAAALFPNRNREVCLSAPVFLEYLDVPLNTI